MPSIKNEQTNGVNESTVSLTLDEYKKLDKLHVENKILNDKLSELGDKLIKSQQSNDLLSQRDGDNVKIIHKEGYTFNDIYGLLSGDCDTPLWSGSSRTPYTDFIEHLKGIFESFCRYLENEVDLTPYKRRSDFDMNYPSKGRMIKLPMVRLLYDYLKLLERHRGSENKIFELGTRVAEPITKVEVVGLQETRKIVKEEIYDQVVREAKSDISNLKNYNKLNEDYNRVLKELDDLKGELKYRKHIDEDRIKTIESLKIKSREHENTMTKIKEYIEQLDTLKWYNVKTKLIDLKFELTKVFD